MTSLFDTPAMWAHDPQKAFDAFVQSPLFPALSTRARTADDMAPPALRAGSVKVYRAMFAHYLRWLGERHVALVQATSADVAAFLGQEREVDGVMAPHFKSRIRQRYMRLIERVYQHLQVAPNPARQQIFDRVDSGAPVLTGRDAGVAVLSDAQHRAFILALPALPPAEPTRSTQQGWKCRRNRALQLMMLGAGLKVSEVCGVYTDNVGRRDDTGSVPVTVSPASTAGVSRWHQTQLRPFAAPEVLEWVAIRRTLGIPGPLLFPASLHGGRLDNATIYRQVRKTFGRAGMAVPHQGGRTLRNSFARRELADGESVELVGEFMGHRRRRSTEYYDVALVPDDPTKA